MANKYLPALAAVALISVFGVGVFVGTQVDGEPLSPPAPEGTTTPTAEEADRTPTPEDDPAEVTTEVPPSSFDEAAIAQFIADYLNEARADADATELSTTGVTADILQSMASNHSDAMAAAGEVNHTIDGRDSYDRYEANDIEQQCEFAVNGTNIETPTRDRFEAVGSTLAGQSYTDGGEHRFNGNDSAVARALVDDWLSTLPYANRLTLDGAERVGVGVTITDEGRVYATVNICG